MQEVRFVYEGTAEVVSAAEKLRTLHEYVTEIAKRDGYLDPDDVLKIIEEGRL